MCICVYVYRYGMCTDMVTDKDTVLCVFAGIQSGLAQFCAIG